VDDNDDNRFTLSMHLETCGYSNIVTAEDGREALKKMRSRPVDLALLDIMMPEPIPLHLVAARYYREIGLVK
jgi:CheY-like chemotaxis protein